MTRLILILPLGAIIALTGCGACRTSNFVAHRPYGCNGCTPHPQPPPRNFAAVPGAPGMIPPGRALPPGPAVEGGSATFVPPSGTAPPPPPAALERPVPDLGSSAPPPGETPSDVQLGPPGPIRRDALSAPPDRSTKEPPVASVPGKEADRDLPQAIDLPGFAIAAPGVATGLKPFPDGIAWLAEKGYKATLHLRAPGEDVAATKRLFEAKGLKYLSLEGSPARLTKEVYEQFVKAVRDAENQPLFVWDKDGSVAGGLWYLYYRVAQGETDEKARAEATRLGLRLDDDEHKTMFLAAQKLLEKIRP
jgi:hypothetical protein